MRRILLLSATTFWAGTFSVGALAQAAPQSASAPLAAQASPTTESVMLKRQAELREAPGDSSRSLGSLPAQTAVTRLPLRQGPWIQVRTAQGATGYLHMFDIAVAGSSNASANAGSGTPNAAAGALRGITGFFNRGSAQNTASLPTSTIGIRGLEAEQLARATPNPAAVVTAESNRADAAQAQSFAAIAQLSPRSVDPLPAPAAPQQASPNNNPGGVSFGRESGQ